QVAHVDHGGLAAGSTGLGGLRDLCAGRTTRERRTAASGTRFPVGESTATDGAVAVRPPRTGWIADNPRGRPARPPRSPRAARGPYPKPHTASSHPPVARPGGGPATMPRHSLREAESGKQRSRTVSLALSSPPLPVRRPGTGQRTARQLDGRQSPADVARMVV